MRAAARRAFEACTPAFLPQPGETPSPEPLIAALPQAQRAAREQALRDLYARCQSFTALGREALLKLRGGLAADGGLRDTGQRIDDELAAGNVDQARLWATKALQSGDPASIAALAGSLERLLSTIIAAGSVAAQASTVSDVTAALPLVACDLGLDCSSRSVNTLQLCAVEGWCEGDGEARYLARANVDASRFTAVEAQRRRLLGMFRQGRPPSVEDLLP